MDTICDPWFHCQRPFFSCFVITLPTDLNRIDSYQDIVVHGCTGPLQDFHLHALQDRFIQPKVSLIQLSTFLP